MTTLCLAGNCLFCTMTFLLGSAKADAQNATESVTAVHRANQPNLLNVLMEAILPLFSFRGKRNRQRGDKIGWSCFLWKGLTGTRASTLSSRARKAATPFKCLRDSTPATAGSE
jgi:hypothetical protein